MGRSTEPSAYAQRVLDVVERIPPGRVMSYGDVRDFLGESSARAVGMVMYRWGSEVAWHRVVFADGRLPYGHEDAARALLAAEGTPMHAGRVVMAAARWDGR